jgi:hypothetical protein
VVAGAEIVDEEEELVLQDGAAEGSAKLVLRERVGWNLGGLILVLPGVGVEAIVLQVAVSRSVEFAGTAAEDGDDAGAVDVAELGGRVRRNYLDFIERSGGGAVANFVVEGLVDVEAFECVVIRLGAVAVYVDRVTVIGVALDDVGGGVAVGADRAGGVEGEGAEVETVERKVRDGVRGEGAAEGVVLGVEKETSTEEVLPCTPSLALKVTVCRASRLKEGSVSLLKPFAVAMTSYLPMGRCSM